MRFSSLRSWVVLSALALSSTLPAFAQGSITGAITFEGEPPKMRKIKMDSEQTCKMHHKEPPREEKVVVNKDNKGLQWAFVHIKNPPAGAPAAAGEVTLDQKGCRYEPHVFGIRVGQPLKISNSDQGVLHNVHAFGQQEGNTFNMGQPGGAPPLQQTFKKPEVGVHVKCDVHGWMSSYACVVEHPYFAVSAADGKFTIANVPPGEYEVEAWHEELGTQTAKVKVEGTGAATANFTFKPKEGAK